MEFLKNNEMVSEPEAVGFIETYRTVGSQLETTFVEEDHQEEADLDQSICLPDANIEINTPPMNSHRSVEKVEVVDVKPEEEQLSMEDGPSFISPNCSYENGSQNNDLNSIKVPDHAEEEEKK